MDSLELIKDYLKENGINATIETYDLYNSEIIRQVKANGCLIYLCKNNDILVSASLKLSGFQFLDYDDGFVAIPERLTNLTEPNSLEIILEWVHSHQS